MVVVEEAFPLSVGLSVSDNHSKMEGPFNGTLQDTQISIEEKEKEKEESLIEDNKEQLVVELDEVPATDGDAKSISLIENPSVVDIAITDEQATRDEENVEEVVEETETETENVSESVNVSSPNEVKADEVVDNTLASETVELELKQESKGEDFVSLEDIEKTEDFVSLNNDEGLRESTEVVETTKDMKIVEEEEDVLLSSVVTDVVTEEPNPIDDVVSKESDESERGKGIEKVEEQLDVQEASSYESAKESYSYQPLTNVPHAESNSVTVQENNEEKPRSIENPAIISVTQRQRASWTSCCGLLDVLRHGGR